MSSVWLVMSDFCPAEGEGFHVTAEAARARAEEKSREDRAAYDAVKQWLEIPVDEFRAIRGMPSAYDVPEVPDTVYEIHRGGSVPDVAWVLIVDGAVAVACGYRVTRKGAEDLLLNREIAEWEAWVNAAEEGETDESFPRWWRDGADAELIRLERQEGSGVVERPTARALEVKEEVLEGSGAPEPKMSVREGTATFTWETPDNGLLEVRVAETGQAVTTIHRDMARPSVTVIQEDVVMRARQALGIRPIWPKVIREGRQAAIAAHAVVGGGVVDGDQLDDLDI